MFFLYILQSLKDSRTYVGYTADLEERFDSHNAGRVKATQYRRPFRIIYTEQVPGLAEAKKRELYFKSGAGRRKLKKIFENMRG